MAVAPDIGAIIKTVVEKRGMSMSEFGRRIGTSRENAYSIFKRKSIDTTFLLKISEVLEHDFFLYYTPVANENEKLKTEMETLKYMLAIMRKMAGHSNKG